MKLKLDFGKCCMCASHGPVVQNLEPEVPATKDQLKDVPRYWSAIDGVETPSPLCFSCVEAFDGGDTRWV